MRKYWAIFRITWQNVFEYRVEFFGHAIANLIILLVMYYIWLSVFKNRTYFGDYTFSSLMTYLLVGKFLHFVNRQNVSRSVAEEIKNGDLSIYLVKPVSYPRWQVARFLSLRIFDGLLNLLLFLLIFSFFPDIFIRPTFISLIVFCFFLGLSLLINFFVNLLIAVFAFFVTDIKLFRTTVGIILDFLAGSLVPLDLMPSFLKNVSQVLPFQFSLYFPVKIFQGNLSLEYLLKGVSLCFFWIFIFIIISKYFWKKGLRCYEAVGR